MKSFCLCFLFVYLVALAVPAVGPDALAAEKSLFTGKVSDAAGRPVEGAMVFVYTNASVRRSADFMSPPTDSDGLYRVFLPPGRYWAVARLKKTEGVGPLMPGDKHSGDPVEVDITLANETGVDFTVADLKEAVEMREKPREGSVRITGRITDEKGAPLVGVYAVVCRRKEFSAMPDYLSAWVDDNGQYTLYIPKGKYYLGSAVAVPPGDSYVVSGEITADADKDGVDVVRKTARK
ncbi:MAG: carboxypeptidase-like regulatory domain-containing protein [Acidobacteriota bacterium]